ncbi:MAG: DUF5667 domain-containing protein [bacterium]|nr:DUF5667 domain-containing protein [bacterium]
MAALAIILALSLGGGTAYAAADTLPGDTLYPVKIHVNERLRAAAAIGAEADATLDGELAVRRLDEAARLRARGATDPATQARIVERFERHMHRMEQRITKLEANGKTDAAAALSEAMDARLRAHAELLTSLPPVGTNTPHDTTGDNDGDVLTRATLRRADAMARIRVQNEDAVTQGNPPDVRAAAEGRRDATAKKLDAAAAALAAHADRLDASVRADAEARLTAARELFATGEVQLTSAEYGAAFRSFQQAHHEAQRALHTARLRARADAAGDADEQDAQQPDGAADARGDAAVELDADPDAVRARINANASARTRLRLLAE